MLNSTAFPKYLNSRFDHFGGDFSFLALNRG